MSDTDTQFVALAFAVKAQRDVLLDFVVGLGSDEARDLFAKIQRHRERHGERVEINAPLAVQHERVALSARLSMAEIDKTLDDDDAEPMCPKCGEEMKMVNFSGAGETYECMDCGEKMEVSA